MMCGICGFSGFVDEKLLHRMCGIIEHRGPDDDGYYEDEHVSLAMRRLSIIDLQTGKQPIHNEDETVWVVLNGEIYNYAELAQKLTARGHRLYTKSDTEVIVHLYEEYGLDFVQHLQGMFAIAVRDSGNRRLVLVRDRLGIKPLYYMMKNGRILFSSEMKSLLCFDGFSREIDYQALTELFAFNYVPAPRTIFKSIRKLLPGHLLVMDDDDNSIQTRKYWDIPLNDDLTQMDETELIEAVRSSLERSVRFRMISDVSLGAFLSGGLDSSAIVGIMAENSGKSVKTFTVGFGGNGAGYNELEEAKRVAEYFGTEHHEIVLDYDIMEILPQVVWHFDEPFGNSTSVCIYLLCEFARQYVTVALSGTCGDELFLGYPRHQGLGYLDAYRKIPLILRKGLIEPTIRWLPESTRGNRFADRLAKRSKRFISGAYLSPQQMYIDWLIYLDKETQRRLFSPRVMAEIADADPTEFMQGPFDTADGLELGNMASYIDLKMFLPNNQLEYMDKMSMAQSLEARVPFVDHELVELVMNIPAQLKLNGRTTKYILKKACETFLPEDIVYRRKVGFDAPVGSWIKHDLRRFTEILFSPESLSKTGIFDPITVNSMLQEHLAGKRDLSSHLWMILFFEIWYRMYITQGIVDKPDFPLMELM
jgi:asparagine synthase (glutamine-hydrolysing)